MDAEQIKTLADKLRCYNDKGQPLAGLVDLDTKKMEAVQIASFYVDGTPLLSHIAHVDGEPDKVIIKVHRAEIIDDEGFVAMVIDNEGQVAMPVLKPDGSPNELVAAMLGNVREPVPEEKGEN